MRTFILWVIFGVVVEWWFHINFEEAMIPFLFFWVVFACAVFPPTGR